MPLGAPEPFEPFTRHGIQFLPGDEMYGDKILVPRGVFEKIGSWDGICDISDDTYGGHPIRSTTHEDYCYIEFATDSDPERLQQFVSAVEDKFDSVS